MSGHESPRLSVLPAVESLVAAMDELETVAYPESASSGAGSLWGVSGLGAQTVSARDIELLARLQHRLNAQIGRLVRGSVVTEPSKPSAAGPLIPFDTDSFPDGVENGEGADASKDSSVTPQPPDPDSDAAAPGDSGESERDNVDHARPGVEFGAQSALVMAAWPEGRARALIKASAFVSRYPELEKLWRAGEISTDMIMLILRTCKSLTDKKREEFVSTLVQFLPGLTHRQVKRIADRVLELVKPESTDDDEDKSYRDRELVFSSVSGAVLFQGRLPKLEGQLFMDSIEAMAQSLRVEGDRLIQSQRNADALVEILARSARTGDLPKLGGLPVSVSLTMTAEQAAKAMELDPQTGSVDQDTEDPDRTVPPPTYPDGSLAAWAVARMALCCGPITPIGVAECPATTGAGHASEATDIAGDGHGQGRGRVDLTKLWNRLGLTSLVPLAVGRSQRLATAAQRKALAVRDGGCVIPGCGVPANHTQPHHVIDYSLGGPTDLDNLASLCWTHHRQVDLGLWVLKRRSEESEPDLFRPECDDPSHQAPSPASPVEDDGGRSSGPPPLRSGMQAAAGFVPGQRIGKATYWVARPVLMRKRR